MAREARKTEQLYEGMLRIRRAEERLQKLFADGEVPGFVHLSIGQEAVPVGVSSALRPDDTVASNHRGHGHALAKGIALDALFAEIMGREAGICKGRGGSMHVADLSIGMLGANGIVGAGLPIALGSALAHGLAGSDAVAVVYFGDGALAEGVLHECLNMAALWSAPLLFVCENNGWSEFSPTDRQMAAKLSALAAAFGLTHEEVDGNDVEAVAAAARSAIAALRRGKGARVLECRTTRVRGHFEGDKQDYREAAELSGLGERDPLGRLRATLEKAGRKASWFDTVESRVAGEIDAAVEAARAAPEPGAGAILADVYTPAEGSAHG